MFTRRGSKTPLGEVTKRNQEELPEHRKLPSVETKASCSKVTGNSVRKRTTLPLHVSPEINSEGSAQEVMKDRRYKGLRTIKRIPRHIPHVRSLSSCKFISYYYMLVKGESFHPGQKSH